ncbi:hypothetical protein [Methanosphaera cuniculi]|uniref:hypothetical protein n=1 Tax=Methanosphaera cuniculi TaxID=1077256 RepID=UPI0026ECF08E|nr:hypothetical protein [Methanosphaera cuniculi]
MDSRNNSSNVEVHTFATDSNNNVSTHEKYSLVELDENNNVKRIIHDDVNTEILKQINMNLLDMNNSNKDSLRVIQDDLRRIKSDIGSALLMFVIFLSIIVIIIVLAFIL